MKKEYLEALEERLNEYDISQSEITDILSDYCEMIDDAIAKHLSDEEIIKMIGTPKQVSKDLSEEIEKAEDYVYIRGEHHHTGNIGKNKIVALMPFISLIIFFILGFGFELWNPGWMVFLLIPISAIIVNVFNRKFSHGLVAISPFIALIIYFILGFGFELWHPGWLVFLLIPVMGVISGRKKKKLIPFLTALSPFVAILAFILVSTYAGYWQITWMIFLIIPMIGILNEKKIWKIIVLEASLIIAIGGYLYLGYGENEWVYSLLVFLIPVGVSLLLNEGEFLVIKTGNKNEWLLFLLLAAIYFGAGFLFGSTWGWLWMIFLILPVYAIFTHANEKDKLIAIMPFLSVFIFYTLGYFFGYWMYSWIAFLLIPMVAIIKNK